MPTSSRTRLNARVVVFERLTDDTLVLVADSYEAPAELAGDPILLESARTGSPVRGRTERDGREFAVLAAPAPDRPGTYVLLAAPLADRLSAIDVVRRDLLIFGGIALAASWLVGALAAAPLHPADPRLESAAERIAAGDFEAPIVADGQGRGGRAGPGASIACASGSRTSTRRAGSSSANASHELRTPLFALGGFLELLADEDLDEATRRDFLETARGQVDRLTRLATDLLDLSRLDAGQARVRARSRSTWSPPSRRSRRSSARLPRRQVTSSASRTARLPSASATRSASCRIGRALVENALAPHARRHDGGAARVDLGRSARSSPCTTTAPVSLRQSRSGCSSASTAADGSAPEGSGIGLAIARELARRMGGTIELRSEPGATTFTLALARAAVAAFPRENVLVLEP